MIDPESLLCFLEASRLLSFRAASRVVALSPAAFGQRIKQLEETLGEALFHRTTRTVLLTEAGLRLRPRAEAAVTALAACRAGAVEDAPIELVLGTRHELGVSWILPAVQAAQREWRGLTVHLYVGSGSDLVHRVRSLAIDCAVSSARLLDPKLAALPLHEERYVVVAAPRLLRRLPLRNAADARAHTLFDTTEELPLYRYWRDAGAPIDSTDFQRVVRLGAIEIIRASVLTGDGVAVLPRYYVEPHLRAGRLQSLFPKVPPGTDAFRLFFRADDPRRALFERLGGILAARALR